MELENVQFSLTIFAFRKFPRYVFCNANFKFRSAFCCSVPLRFLVELFFVFVFRYTTILCVVVSRIFPGIFLAHSQKEK